jgi:hypothetical protein
MADVLACRSNPVSIDPRNFLFWSFESKIDRVPIQPAKAKGLAITRGLPSLA